LSALVARQPVAPANRPRVPIASGDRLGSAPLISGKHEVITPMRRDRAIGDFVAHIAQFF